MNNIFNRFQSLTPATTMSVVTITVNNGDGTSDATTLAGIAIVVKGESVTPGNRAYVRNGEIVRPAPNLTISNLEV